MTFDKELTSCFKKLAETLSGYETRAQQIEMASEVLKCYKDKKKLLIEAGTGVGKSFGYLIPAILSKRKTIISTASIALQDQLVNKDLIFLKMALSYDFSFALLKGKGNYLCLKREREFMELDEFYIRFRKWASETKTGDKDELQFIPDFWAKVCCDPEDCTMRMCVCYDDCFYYKHFRSLYKKDILVVNHHLLAYDYLSNFKLLPFHKQLIIDEAHQLENVISKVCGSTLNHFKLALLLYRLKGLKMPVDKMFGAVDSFFKKRNISGQPVSSIPESIIAELKHLNEILDTDKLIAKLKVYKEEAAEKRDLSDRIEMTINYVQSLERNIVDFIEHDNEDKVYYIKGNRQTLELKSNLVESQKPFMEICTNYESIVMTSATLTTSGNFDFIKERLGIKDFKEILIGSPFDYKKQAMLYISRVLPRPDKDNKETFQQKSLEVIEELIHASRGRALVLFTSYSHLRFVSENIKTGYNIRSQGEMPVGKLIEWFMNTPNSVLLATATFWQGIDMKGEKLSLVIIAKMPFGSPGDPLYDERCRRLKGQWFFRLALPSAILLLRQGFGRLIRGGSDYGVVAILDTRLVKSSYSRIIISSLPEIEIVHTIKDVDSFFKAIP